MSDKRTKEIEELTGLVYCDENCLCGRNDQHFTTVPGNEMPEWVPDWMNCCDLQSVERWLVENGYLTSASVPQERVEDQTVAIKEFDPESQSYSAGNAMNACLSSDGNGVYVDLSTPEAPDCTGPRVWIERRKGEWVVLTHVDGGDPTHKISIKDDQSVVIEDLNKD
jgi:hypothetical protein